MIPLLPLVAASAASLAAASSVPLYASEGLQKRAVGGGLLDSKTSDLTPVVAIQVGTPPQTLQAQLDVTSGLTVVGGSPFAGGAFYAPASSSLKEGAKVDSYDLADGRKTSGERATDRIAVGASALTTEFLLTSPSGQSGPEAPGINNAFLGLGYKDAPSPALSSEWDQKLWGLYLTPRRVGYSGKAGETKRIGSLSLGKIDSVYAAGEPVWVNLTETATGEWPVHLKSFSAGSATAKADFFEGRQIDVAPVANIGLPAPALDGFMKSISGAQKWTQGEEVVWTLPCETSAKLDVGLENITVSLAPEDWIAKEGTTCRALLTAATGRPWLGTPFLSAVYSVWDLEGRRIGFAPVKAATRVENKDFNEGSAPARQSTEPVTTGKTYAEGSKVGSASGAGVAKPALLAMALTALAATLF